MWFKKRHFLNNSVTHQPIFIKFDKQLYEEVCYKCFNFVHLALKCTYPTVWNWQNLCQQLTMAWRRQKCHWFNTFNAAMYETLCQSNCLKWPRCART